MRHQYPITSHLESSIFWYFPRVIFIGGGKVNGGRLVILLFGLFLTGVIAYAKVVIYAIQNPPPPYIEDPEVTERFAEWDKKYRDVSSD